MDSSEKPKRKKSRAPRSKPSTTSTASIAATADRYLEAVDKHGGVEFSGRVLYVGANPNAFAFWERLKECILRIVEIFAPNAEALRDLVDDARIDVADIRTLELDEDYDLAIWWHGPEHVASNEVRGVLEKLEEVSRCVLIGCPNGMTEQGPIGGNEAERHLCPLNGPYFERRGYRVTVIGAPGAEKSQIIATKGC